MHIIDSGENASILIYFFIKYLISLQIALPA